MNQDFYPLTLNCSNNECRLAVRIGRVLSKPVLRVGAFEYCPVCGKKALTLPDNDETYWETLAQSYGVPIEALRILYDIWDTKEYYKFSDFVEQMKEEVKNDNKK